MQVENSATAGGTAVETIDTCTQRQRLLVEAEAGQYREASRLQQQPGAQRPRFCKALHQCDAMAGIGQQRRRSLATDAAADHRDIERDPHGPILGRFSA